MNFSEIESAVKHILKTSKCLQCDKKFKADNVNILATTKTEGLFDLMCGHCFSSTIMTVSQSAEKNIVEEAPHRIHKSISQNDVLDLKNFLTGFDGNFKKIFTKKK